MKVVIPQDVHDKIMYWVKNTDIEVSGLGKVVLDKATQTFTVTSAILCKQTGTGTTTSIPAAEVAKAMFETREQEGTLAFWWHSHVKMAAFWSGTDTATIEDTAQGGLCVATVFNHMGDTKTAVAYKAVAPWGDTIVRYDDVSMSVPAQPNPYAEAWKAELDAKLQAPMVAHEMYNHLSGRKGYAPKSSLKQQGFLFNDLGSKGDRRNHLSKDPDVDAGITGMGIDAEAKILQVSVKALRKIVKKGENDLVFREYERRLYANW